MQLRPKHRNGLLWGAAVILIVTLYGPGLDLPGRALREVLVAVCAPVLLGVGLLRARERPSLWLLVLLAAALFSSAAGVARSPEPERSIVARDWIVLAAPWLIGAAAALAGRGDDHELDAAIELAASVALLGIGVLGLWQAWTGWTGFVQVRPPAATFVNRNVAAQTLVMLLPLAATPLLRPLERWRQLLAIGATGSGLALLVATRSRGAWIGVACGAAAVAIVWSWSLKNNQRPRLQAGALALAVGLAAIAALIPTHRSLSGAPTTETKWVGLAEPEAGSSAVRLALWSNAAALSTTRPWLGSGAGRFPVEYPRYQAAVRATPDFGTEYQPVHPHNDWLEYAVELGWPAALALATAFVVGLLMSLCGKTNETRTQTLRRAARAAAITGVMAHSLVSFPLHAPASACLAWLVVGRAWASHNRTFATTFATTARVRRVGAVAAMLLALAVAGLGAKELAGRAALGRALQSLQQNDCPGAMDAVAAIRDAAVWERRTRATAAMVTFECDASWESSLPVLERAHAENPHQLNLLLAVASRRLKAGNVDGAEAAYRHATEIVPRQAPAWVGLAMTQATRGDRPAATESCRTALQLAPEFASARAFCEANRMMPASP